MKKSKLFITAIVVSFTLTSTLATGLTSKKPPQAAMTESLSASLITHVVER